MVSSMNQFDCHVKELLWHKEKWETNFLKGIGTAMNPDDVETLRINLTRMRAVLDTCENSLDSVQHWDQGAARKFSLKSSLDMNGSGTLLASNSSSERSSNGSPFQYSTAGDGLMNSACFSSTSLGSDDYYDPMNSISDILTDNHEIDPHTGSICSSLSDSTNNTIGFPMVNGGGQAMQSYWPSSWPSSGTSPVGTDVFSAFATSVKPSFAAIAQLPASVDAVVPGRKNSDASPTLAKLTPVISEAPVLMNLQKPHLAKYVRIIYVFPLNYKVDESVLEKHFSQFGKVSKTKIFRYPNGASKTAGIVDFEDASSALMAIKKKYHFVDGCQIEAKPFEPKAHDLGHQAVTQGLVSRSSHFVNNTEFQVFVGGIPAQATDEDIEKAICVFGKVKRIQVNPNGTFAFVSFATEADASKIVGVHSINIAGKLVECKRNQPQSSRSRSNTDELKPLVPTASPSGSACQFCKKTKMKAVLTCDHRVECFECVKQQRICPKCGGKLDLSKEPAKYLSTSQS